MPAIAKTQDELKAEEMIAILRRSFSKAVKSPATAEAFLVRHGYITKSGKLTKRYRS